MASLGDFFADSEKNKFADQAVKVRAVVKVMVSFTTPPKEKRIIIVGTTTAGDYLGVVLINSNINWNVHRNPDIFDYQLFLLADGCDFLEHDSYADCLNIQEIPRSYVVDKVLDDFQRALGDVPAEVFTEIINRLKTSPAIPPKILKKYGLRST